MTPTCLLCDRLLAETTAKGMFLHNDVVDCLVRVADRFGISLDDDFFVEDDVIYPRSGQIPNDEIVIPKFKLTEEAILETFAEVGLERLGGQSTGSGWSNISTFQRCPYAWKRRYLDAPTGDWGERPGLAIGGLVHVYLAIYYTQMMVANYPLTPEQLNQRVRERGCDPDIFTEAWRLFTAYRLYYKGEEIEPLAVEYNLRDPRTNQSCRFDLIAYFPKERPGLLPGTYDVEHKTAARFDANTLEGWINDGEILGQVDLWERLHLERKFGPMRGVMVNLLGKQKVPEFHRTIVAPSGWQIEQHRQDGARWGGLIQLARSTNSFPRARNGCIGRYGRCDHWDHCALNEEGA